MLTCIYPGSFDPPTLGHLDVVGRAAALFDRVIVAVMDNGQKRSAFTPLERADMLRRCTRHLPAVEVIADGGLLADAAVRVGARVILRGMRGEADCAAEGRMAAVNRHLSGLETAFLFTSPQYSYLSSTLVRDVARHGGDVAGLVPDEIAAEVRRKFNQTL
ncbi:MAG: pantetheine-phosphate adenylyltransferase [Clostridiales bacterium]|nr:pantetheine-phosphate adenylyltransferase [Clostridiales bacterium]